MLDRVHGVFRNVTALFGRVEGQQSTCPRCRGSGLLESTSTFFWNLPPSSNDPCWFCEGVGVMPIIGLNGFLVARSKPAFQTNDFLVQPQWPIELQLYFGKFTGTNFKCMTFKPSGNFLDSLEDLDNISSKSKENFLVSVVYQKSFQKHLMSQAPAASSSGSIYQQYKSPSKISQNSRKNEIASPKLSRSCKSPQAKRASSSPAVSRNDPKNPYSQSNDIGLPSRSSQKMEADSLAESRLMTASFVQSSNGVALDVSLANGYNAHLLKQSEAHFSQHAVDDKKSGLANLSMPNSRLASSPICPRSSRRRRNQIRERAEKEALERARRIQRTLAPRNSQMTSPSNDERPESLHSSRNRNWKDISRSCHEAQTSKGKSVPAFLLAEALSIRKLALAGQSWINQLVNGQVQEALHFPRPGQVSL